MAAPYKFRYLENFAINNGFKIFIEENIVDGEKYRYRIELRDEDFLVKNMTELADEVISREGYGPSLLDEIFEVDNGPCLVGN